ncbi:MAG: excinuclease ABC subunit UvrC [Gammaproteobacteria bacterium]|nr:excinuclease ABC subunit UvrC [Gammaproteobacteria bacterium]
MSVSDFDLRAFARDLPDAPGVYQMLNAEGNVLYVGKALSLKKRVASYFGRRGLNNKTLAMLEHVARVEVTLTGTEGAALLLENDLIKAHRPRYNIVLRDDKSYPYILLSQDHPYPRFAFYRGAPSRRHRLFGPFASAGAVRETLGLLQKVFPVRQCEDTFYRNRTRPCLQYQIGRCTAPCVGLVSESDYAADLNQAVMFLEGRDQGLVDELAQRMHAAAKDQDYERAASCRDRINALRRVLEANPGGPGLRDADVLAVEMAHGKACVEVLYIRGGRSLGSRPFFPRVGLDPGPAEVLEAFISQHYLPGTPVPELVSGYTLAGRELLEEALEREAGRRVRLRHARRGAGRQWLDLAARNARESLRRKLIEGSTIGNRFRALGEALALGQVPEHIECLDISHTQGEETVGSCVVFDLGGPRKSAYRRYNIEGITPGDDYAALAQLVRRRYPKRRTNNEALPQVLLIDGGRGQLSAVRAVLDEEKISEDRMLLVAVAKGASRKPGREQLFLSGRGTPLILAADSPALHLVQQIRDEAHRFAITGHRRRRGKRAVRSSLEGIPGVGPARRQALLTRLGGQQGVQRAGIADLTRVPGISDALARRIFESLHGH